MTGIERLREFVAGISPITVVCGVTRTAYDREHMEVAGARLRDFLSDIADQIEREHAEDCFRMGERAADVSMSAYDLLPADEREAIAWVREHGGISVVKNTWDRRSNLRHQLNAAQTKVKRLRDHALWLEGECRGRQGRIVKLNRLSRDYRYALNGVCEHLGLADGTGLPDMPEVIWAELDRRLMPEGMEEMIALYPRYEDGTPALPGMDAVANSGSKSGETFTIRKAWLENGTWHLSDHVADGHNWHWKHKDRVVKRPAKVLDADGVETRLNDKVYDQDGTEWYVNCIPEPGDPSKIQLRRSVKPQGSRFVAVDPQTVTHRAPVLAADGKPLREGETVWGTGREQHEYTVLSQPGLGGGTGRFKVTCHDVTDDVDCYCDPSQLTHERPDSWERLEEDATKPACLYFNHVGVPCADEPKCPAYGQEVKCYAKAAADLVRRARALAERGR